jgi:hypothetical protein
LDEITARQASERHDALETEGATLLGRLLFEFARLDTNLGLCLVWIEDGRRLETLTRQVAEFGFHQRLEFLGQVAEVSLSIDSAGRREYADWISQAHGVRKIRNELVHGRWGVNPYREEVINVVGLPISEEQREIRYELSDLKRHLLEIQRLGAELSALRDRWRL